MARKAFYFDMTACVGCRTCQVACKDRNDLPIGIIYRQVRNFEVGKFPKPMAYNYSGTCNHCAGAKCVKGCPTGALHFVDGTVQHDRDRCVGCQYCTWNCPYGVPKFNAEKGVVGKCDMCKSWTDNGHNPICVDACNMRVIEWGDYEELSAKHPGCVSELPILPKASICEPSLLIRPKPCAYDTGYRLKHI